MLSRLRLSLCLLLAALLRQCFAGQWVQHNSSWSPDYVLVATAKNITIDCKSRYSVVINETFPGPTLYLKEGKTTWVRVYNNIKNENFTVHWHGLAQRTAPFSDGTPHVAQWPIAPGEFFDYELHPDIGDAGSYFYHSHVGFQAVTAQGPLIVEDAGKPPYKYDEDIVINLSDFFAKNDSTITSGLLANPFKWSGEPDALIFGDRSGNASFSNATDDSCKPFIVSVKPGKTYRMRFIGRTALSFITLGMEGHENLTIIEADGHYTKPFTTDHLQVGSGQRFSILFTAKSQAEIAAGGNKTQFWIRYESRARPLNVTGYALLEYVLPGSKPAPLPKDLPSKSPVVLSNDVSNWLEYSLQSLNSTEAATFPRLSEVTRTIYITMAQELFDGAYVNNTINGSLRWAQNTLVWQEPAIANENYPPFLVSVYNDPSAQSNYTAATTNVVNNSISGYDPKTKTFPALVGETIDIVWLSNSGPTGGWDVHPMHAHGAHYWDLGSGNGTYNATANEARFLNGYTPVKRDTTMVYRYAVSGEKFYTAGWRAWRIRVTEDNVGAWMMHCHVLQHMVMGMQTVWVFGSREQILKKFPQQPYVDGYLKYGGSAYGNSSYDPLVWEYGGGK